MKAVDARYEPKEGLVIRRVTNLTTFLQFADEADLTNALCALMVVVKDDGDVQFVYQAAEKLALIGALDIAKGTLVQHYIDVEDDPEETEGEDDDSEG